MDQHQWDLCLLWIKHVYTYNSKLNLVTIKLHFTKELIWNVLQLTELGIEPLVTSLSITFTRHTSFVPCNRESSRKTHNTVSVFLKFI